MDQALKEVHNLTVTLLVKEFSSDNLESIFKVRACTQSVCARSSDSVVFVALGTLDPVY